MKLVGVPVAGGYAYINPEYVISIEDGDESLNGFATSVLNVAHGKSVVEYKCRKHNADCSPEYVARLFEDTSVADAIIAAMRHSFGDSSGSSPAFLEAIAMQLGYGNYGFESPFEKISDALNNISASIEHAKE